MEKFLPPGIEKINKKIFFIMPAIDPLSTKNLGLPKKMTEEVLTEFGLDTGGIPLQMSNGTGGYLANSEDEYISKISFLLNKPDKAKEAVYKGYENIKKNFLITRLLRDELKLFKSLI